MSRLSVRFVTDSAFDDRLDWLTRAHVDDAGLDLRAAETCWLEPAASATIPTGIRMAIPRGCCGLVLPRSGLASRFGLTIPNAPGLIDAGYRGEIGVLVRLEPTQSDIRAIAEGREPRTFTIKEGDRIAQLVIVELAAFDLYRWWGSLGSLGQTERGEGGFGSSGR